MTWEGQVAKLSSSWASSSLASHDDALLGLTLLLLHSTHLLLLHLPLHVFEVVVAAEAAHATSHLSEGVTAASAERIAAEAAAHASERVLSLGLATATATALLEFSLLGDGHLSLRTIWHCVGCSNLLSGRVTRYRHVHTGALTDEVARLSGNVCRL